LKFILLYNAYNKYFFLSISHTAQKATQRMSSNDDFDPIPRLGEDDSDSEDEGWDRVHNLLGQFLPDPEVAQLANRDAQGLAEALFGPPVEYIPPAPVSLEVAWDNIPEECQNIDPRIIMRTPDGSMLEDLYGRMILGDRSLYYTSEHPNLGVLYHWNSYYFVLTRNEDAVRGIQYDFENNRLTYDQIEYSTAWQ
jgi:hypothetical protein